jgi:hypothetical protein
VALVLLHRTAQLPAHSRGPQGRGNGIGKLSRVRAPWRERRPIPFDDQNSQSAVPPLSSGRLRWSVMGAPILVASCSPAVVLDPQGPIASAERLLLINATAIMLVVVIPVILATLAFAWWYRSSNTRARRSPDESYEGRIEFVVWSIPALTVILLGGVIWIGSHQLDPRAPIPAQSDPLRVDVVALDWKWLFIYPDKGAAIVNQLVGKIVLKGRAGECPPTSLAGRHTTVISSANTPGNPRGANAVPSRV